MLHELRVYETMPGKLPALNDRFANHTTGFFKNHGIGMLGFWTDEIGDSNKLTYILSFDSMADREQKMTAFQADRAWQEVRAETEQDGPFVARVLNTFLQLTPYSPLPKISTNVQELRTYEAVPGNLPALNDRFANHTSALFQKHGMEVVGFWTEVVGTSNQLVYMLGYDGLGAREESWGAFQNDADWQKARAASEVNGPLVKRSHNRIIRRTAYSP
jgi:hypothetical protein